MRMWLQRFVKMPSRLLIVDPYPEDVAGLVAQARSHYRVEVVSSGRQALDRLASFHPEIVVTEIDLPDMSGIDLIRQAQSQNQYRAVVWVVATARASVADKVASFQAGAAEHLVKPLNASQMMVVLRSAFHLHELAQKLAVS
jgi:CheY-like chemotaxis protein